MSLTEEFSERFKQAIVYEDIGDLEVLYLEFPFVHNAMINNMTPIDYTLYKYITGREKITGMDEIRLAIIKMVIAHSTPSELNFIDDEDDSIMSRIFFCSDLRIEHTLMVACVRHGYLFDRKPTLDIVLYLQKLNQDHQDLYKPSFDFMIDNMEKNLLKNSLENIIRSTVCFKTKDIRYVIQKLSNKGVQVPRGMKLINHMLSLKCHALHDDDEMIKKIDMVLDELHMCFQDDIIQSVCSIPISPRLLRHVIHRMSPRKPTQQDLDKALLWVVEGCDARVSDSDKELIKILCDLGADVGYHPLHRNQWGSAIGKSISWGNRELLNLLLSFAPTRLLNRAKKMSANTMMKDIIQQHENFRHIMTTARTPTRKRTLEQRFVSSLPQDVSLQLQSMLRHSRSKKRS